MIDCYLVPTANGQKAAIMLEELGLVYRPLHSNRELGAAPPADYLAINPMGKYPAIVDPDGPGGTPIYVFETLAIVLYLAEKCGRLIPKDARARTAMFEWAALASTDLTPMMATQYFLTLRATSDITEATAWVVSEVERFLKAIDGRLGESAYLAGRDYSLADVLMYPLMATSVQRLEGGYSAYAHIKRWVDAVAARPAVQKGMAAAG